MKDALIMEKNLHQHINVKILLSESPFMSRTGRPSIPPLRVAHNRMDLTPCHVLSLIMCCFQGQGLSRSFTYIVVFCKQFPLSENKQQLCENKILSMYIQIVLSTL